MTNRIARLIAAAVVLLAVAGCGSSVTGVPKPGEIDVRTLDVGKYSIEPLDTYFDYLHSVRSGTALATARLANHVAIGLDIDARLRYGTGTQEITKPDDVKNVLAEQSIPIAVRNKMQFGFASGSSDFAPQRNVKLPPEATLTTVTVMQFPDNESAARAATEFDETDFAVAPDQNERVQLTKHPLAHSHWRPGTPTLGSVLAHGNYVVNAFITMPRPDLAELTALAEDIYSAQLPMLDTLPSLSPEQVLRLDNDPDGMIRRVVNPEKLGVPDVSMLATYEAHGLLHFETDRMAAKDLYIDAERVAVSFAYIASTNTYTGGIAQSFGKGTGRNMSGGLLFRARDGDSARSLWSKILDAPDPGQAPANVPDSKCAAVPSERDVNDFVCAVRYRNYVGYVWSTQLLDAQQRAAAQYALLANSQ